MANTLPRAVVVTGGTGGLGPTVIRRLLADGYRCIVMYRTPEKWQTLQAEIQHTNLLGVQADLLDETAVQGAIAQVHDMGGGLYALVHLAGGFASGKVEDTSLDAWNHMITTNLTAAFIATRAIVPHLKENGSGRIVTIGSAAASKRQAGVAAYVVAKSGLAALTDVLANELQNTGITANMLVVGSLDTAEMQQVMDRSKLVPLDRIAATISFLLSDQAASVTGASIPVTVTT